MTEQIIYQCGKCGKYFRSNDDNVHPITQFYCAQCGKVRDWPADDPASKDRLREGERGNECEACRGFLRERTVAACPQCKSKNVEIRGSVSALK
ncbi:MAG: hypothetical protein WC552_05340 [Candidatus Omnitrophota bacterium]